MIRNIYLKDIIMEETQSLYKVFVDQKPLIQMELKVKRRNFNWI